MRVLALDTSTLTAGVALVDGARLFVRQRVVSKHSDLLLTLVDEVLGEAGLRPRAVDGVVCGAGPGSFTGLRIGLATAKGLCFALGRPLVLVSSLAALAARAPGGRVLATLDAHKGELYGGLFDLGDGLPRPVGDEQVLPPEAWVRQIAAAGPLLLVGEGARRYPELLLPNAQLLDDGAPGPAELARLGLARLAAGDHDDLATAAPRYIRPSEAELLKAKSP